MLGQVFWEVFPKLNHVSYQSGLRQAMFDRTGAAIDPGTAIEFEGHVQRTKTALGADFQSAWDDGYASDDDDAVATAAAYRT